MACFLSQPQPQGPLRDLQGKLSEEVRALSGIALAQFRECGVALGRLMDAQEKDSREKLDCILADAYAGLARNLAVLRQRLGDEMHQALEATQAPLWSAAVAARSLPSDASVAARSPPAQEVASSPGPGFPLFAQGEQGEGDSFGPLHQNVLLSCLSSLAEVAPGQGGSWGKSEEDRRVEQVLQKVLNSSEGAPESSASGDPPPVARFNVEFTTAQLRRMQRAVRDRDPEVAGAQGLLQDTLDRYSELAKAMVAAYGDESVLRASPAEVAQHETLLGLVRELRELWRDAGALLEASRRADLLALERVRVRHRKVVLNAFRKGGDEAAAVVLARLALVDEMLEDPSERRFTKSVPLMMRKPYELVEGIVARLGAGGADAPARQPHRRRRWLRCPHCTTHVVVAGEVWCQLMHRFLYAEAAFDPLSVLGQEPLTQREFRILSVLLELQMSERTCNVVYESAVDLTREITGNAVPGQATVAGLQELVLRYGERGSGDLGIVVSAALSAAWVGVHAMHEELRSPQRQKERARRRSQVEVEDDKVRKALKARATKRKSIFTRPRMGGREPSPGWDEPDMPGKTSGGRHKKGFTAAIARALGKDPSAASGQPLEQSAQRAKASAPMVCQRCLSGDMPTFPHVSVGVLSRDNLARAGSAEPGGPAPAAPDLGTAAPPREATGPDEGTTVHSAASLAQADMGDEVIEEQFGEDMVLSMATSVLANSILLCKDERGAYFRWLARIVLYSSTSVLERSDATPQLREATLHGHQTGNVLPGKKREPHLAREPGLGESLPALTLSKPSTPMHPATIATGLARAAASHGGRESEAVEDQQADPALPEPILKALRHDCGLSHPNDKRDDKLESPADALPARSLARGLGVREARRNMTVQMFDDVQDRFAKGGTSFAHRLKRKARAARLMVQLRALNVDAHAIAGLQRELQAVAESTVPSFTGAILLGGAARAAQFLLKPNGIRQRRRSTDSSRPPSQLSHTNKGARELPRGLGGAPAEETGLVTAAEVIQLSSSSALQCYDQVGFGCPVAQQRAAAALQFLERQVFPQAPAGGGAVQRAPSSRGTAAGFPRPLSPTVASRRRRGEKLQELTRSIAPLLLPADVARKMVDRHGQEDGDPVRRGRSIRNTEDRTVAFQEVQGGAGDEEAQGTALQRPEPGCDAPGPSAAPASPSAARSPRGDQHRSRRPRALAHLAQCVSDTEASPADDAPVRPLARTPPQPPPLGPKSASSPCLSRPPCLEKAQYAFAESSTEWHPEVRGLLDTVSTRGQLLRSTVSARGAWARRSGAPKGQRSSGAKLPAVAKAERRGGGGAVAFRDRVLTDGWRAKFTPEPWGADRPKSRALQPQVELASGRPLSRSTPGSRPGRSLSTTGSLGGLERGSSPLWAPAPRLPGPAAQQRGGP